MSKLQTIGALVSDGAVQFWIDRLVQTKPLTWQRNEAHAGLRGAVALAVGAEKAVSIEVAHRAIDSTIVVDEQRIPLNFVRQQTA